MAVFRDLRQVAHLILAAVLILTTGHVTSRAGKLALRIPASTDEGQPLSNKAHTSQHIAMTESFIASSKSGSPPLSSREEETAVRQVL